MAVLGIDLPLLLVLAGVGLLILETTAPTEYFLIVGAALLLAGLTGTFVTAASGPLALAGLVLLFGVATFFGYRELDLYGDGSTAQTSDSSSLRGKTGRVIDRVTSSDGRVKLEDGGFSPYFQARALDEPLEEGEEVVVVDPGGGNVLTVMARSGIGTDEIDRELEREASRSGTDTDHSAGDDGEEAESVLEDADVESERSR